MELIKSVIAMAAVVAATVGYAGDSAPFPLDTTSFVGESITISWDASWIGGDANATVVISDNGTEVKRTTGSGQFTYPISGVVRHELTYTTCIGDVAQDEVYTATMFKGWKYEVVNGGAVISGVAQTAGTIAIPSIIDGYTVTGIADGAFSGCSGLTSVTIPDSVTSIGGSAFSGCSGLTSVTIPDGVTSIGSSAFYGCSGLAAVYITDLAKWCGISFGNSNANPLDYAHNLYLNGVLIRNLMIPDGVTSIVQCAFAGCSGLTSVTIPDSVTSVGSSAFSDCSGLTSVMITDSVTNIGSYAFSGCSGLTSVTIPDSVTSIGAGAFSGCSGLEGITLPFVGSQRGNSGSLNSLFGYIFGPSSYTGSTQTKQYYSSSGYSTFYIPSNLKRIVVTDETVLGYGAFYNCTGLESMEIPDGVTSIGSSAFYGCSGLTSVTIPDSVTSIGAGAFYGCSGFVGALTIPDSVTSIGSSAFSGCSGLTSVTIPHSLASIGSSAFFGCSGLTAVYIMDIAKWCEISFGSSDANPLYYAHNLYLNGSLIQDLTIPDRVTSIGSSAFSGCSGLTSVAIPHSLASIGSSAFSGCSGLTAVYITDIAKWCGISFGSSDANPLYYAHNFYLNGSLIQDLTIPDSVTSVGASAFSGSGGLTSVTIPDSVTCIGDSAFRDCSGITNVAIGEGVESIGANAFVGCTSVTNVTIAGDKFICGDSVAGFYEAEFLNMNSLDGLVSIADNARATTQSAAMLYASDIGTYRMYAYGAYMHFEGGITYHFSADYDDYSFVKIDDTMIISPSSSQCAKQTGSISFAESGWHWLELRGHNYGGRGALNNGNEEGFWWWTSADATNRKFEDPGDGSLFRTSMSSTMSGLFPDSYAQIKRVSLVGDWESIPEGFYAGCSSLESVKIPGSVTNIGANAFEGCPDSIYDVTTISGVKLVDGWVVGYTDSLSGSLNLSEVIGIADGAFKNCSFAFSVILPSNVERISDGEFSGCSGLTGVTIGDCVWDIGEGAFAGCTSLRRVEAAIGLKRLLEKNGVFADCSDDLEIVYHRTAEICNVVARQRKPWNGKVDITFELEGNVAAGFPTNVYPVIVISAADRVNGTNYVAVADALSGDTRTAEGVHHVIWDLNAQGLEFKSDEVVFSVEYGAPVNKYCVIDLSAGANATSYPVSYLYLADEPTDGWTDEYKTTKLVLRRIESGTFTMGSSDVSDNPPHQVTLTKPFYMGVFQVTQKQYELVVGNNPAAYKGDMRPVEQVSWAIVRGDALVYDWPSSTSVNPDSFVGRIQARTGLNFDLPTEAQWEYACRAGTTSRYNNGGDSEDDLKLLGRYSGNQSDGNGGCSQHTTVGSYQSNAWGLYDMHGNVWEWCLDWYDYLNLDVLIDPVGPMTPRDWGDPSRVFRGGAYNMPANMSYSAHRAAYRNTRVSHLTGDFGFRLARTMSEAENTVMVDAGQEESLCSADSAAVAIDSRVEPIVDSVVVSWDASWVGGDAGAKVVIADNGVEIGRKTGLGEFEYMLDGDCRHNLTYTTLIDDVEQTEVYAAKVFKDWKYEVADDAAIMIGTAQTSGTLVIPSEIDGYPVTGIGDGAFAGCGGLTGVTIPDSFIVIGDGAFAGCSNIHAVSLGAQCVAACPGLMQAKFNTRFDLSSMPEDAESADRVSGVIAAYTKVTSPPWEFSDPITGEVYSWNESNSTMAYFGQMYLVGGKTYVFGAHFDDDAYVKVEGQVLISRQSTSGYSIHTGSYSCQKSGWYDVEFRLGDATGGKGSWGNTWSSDFGLGYRDDGNASSNQSEWKRLMDDGDGKLFRTKSGAAIASLFPDSYDKISSITLTGEAESIGDSAFAGCKVLESVDIPLTVTSIGDNAFRDCASLTSITIPESVMNIGDGVFEGCGRLTNVTMPYRFKAQFGAALNGCPITYIATVRFVAVGYEIPTRFVVCGSAVGELTEFVLPTGYSFLGWFTAQDGGAQFWADTVVTEDVTLYARWVANEYDVTFDAAGGEVDGGDGHAGRVTLPMTYDSEYGELPTATRVGYTFDGWMLGGEVVTANTVVKTAEDHTLVARWIANEYQMTLDAAGGAVDGYGHAGRVTLPVTYDSAYGELPTASYDGYVFLGWTLNGSEVTATDIVKTADDHTLTAKWGIQVGNGVLAVTICDEPITLDAPVVPPSGEVTIPATIAGRPVVGITAEAFAGNDMITEIIIPETVTSIEDGAFGGCSGIRNVLLNHVSDEANWMARKFSDSCSSITNVVLGDEIGRVEHNFFAGCGELASVTLPAGLTNIIGTAFSGCSNIQSVVCRTTNEWNAALIRPHQIMIVKVVGDSWISSPPIGDSETVEMTAEAYLAEDGDYTFRWRVSSEEGHDFLCFYVDGEKKAAISGNIRNFEYKTFRLSAGHHVLTWAYEKDASGRAYNDRGIVSDVEKSVVQWGAGNFVDLFADSVDTMREFVFCDGVSALPDMITASFPMVNNIVLPSTLEDFGDNDFRPFGIAEGKEGLWIDNDWVMGYLGTVTGIVSIPEGVKGIASYAFEGQSLLDGVKLPSTLRYVGVNAFRTCTNLAELELPEGIMRIYDEAFADCTYIQKISLPTTLLKIGDDAFRNCSSIMDLTCRDGLLEIGENAFYGCWRMMAVSIPASVTNVGVDAFADCRRLAGVTVPFGVGTMAELFPAAYDKIASVVVTDGGRGATALPMQAGMFAGCAVMESLVLPKGLGEIADEAFVGCESMTAFELPDTVTNIGTQAFKDLTQLAAFTFPTGLVAVGDEAFSGCAGMTALSLPEGLESIGAQSFYGLSLLARIDIPANVSEIGEAAFGGCGSVRAVTLPGDVATVAAILPDAYDKITNAGVGERRDGAIAPYQMIPSLFEGCTALARVDMPTSLSTIGARAFAGCTSLTEAGIPSGVTSLGAEVFSGCSSLSAVALPKGLTVLPDGAFEGCSSLTEIVVPEDVASVGAGVFNGCTLLRSVRFVGNHAPACAAGSYSGSDAALVTYVARGSMGWDGIPTSKSLPEFWPDGTAHEITWWEPNRFDVAFVSSDADGGAATSVVEQVTGTTYMLPSDPTMRGATFGGWWTALDGGARVTPVTQVALTRPHTFFAHWTYNRYAVIFDANGGEGNMAAVDMTVATSAALPECGFTRTGYVFLGWATEPEGGVVYSDEAEVVDLAYEQGAAVTLYAVWEERVWTVGAAMCEGDVLCKGIRAVESADWTVDLLNGHEANSPSARSGAIGAAEDAGRTNSTLSVTVTGEGAGSFWWKVSCEEMDDEYGEWYDYAVFSIDGVEVSRIAGDSGWQQVEYEVTGAGSHVLAWTFTRDDYDEPGAVWENAAWVDDLVWTPVPKVLTLGDVICDGEGSVAATTGGDADWSIDTTMGYADGNSAKSGAVASGQSSWIEVTVSGAGTATFRWNVQGGAYRGTPFAYAKVEVDGVQKAQEYATGGWKEQAVEVEGTGSHTIRWTYLRTSSRAADGDCAWLDCFAWTPCPDIPVDMGGGKSVIVPQTWIEEYPDLVAAAGGDASAALQAKSANGRMSVVECYVVGVDPEKADEDFKIVSFQMNADGTPDLASIVFEPARDNWNVPAAQPVVKGAAELGGEWQTVTEQNKAGMRFFRVEVSLP